MKTLLKLLFIVFCASLILACTKSDHFLEEPNDENLKSGIVLVTVPFIVEGADAEYTILEIDEEYCGLERPFHIAAEASGTAPHLGKYTSYFDFCAGDDGSWGYEGEPIGTFVAANGDELIVSAWGQSGPPNEDDPPHIIERFEALFTILGGTGRFDGATGGGIYSGYNFIEKGEFSTYALWDGEMILVKGKRKGKSK